MCELRGLQDRWIERVGCRIDGLLGGRVERVGEWRESVDMS